MQHTSKTQALCRMELPTDTKFTLILIPPELLRKVHGPASQRNVISVTIGVSIFQPSGRFMRTIGLGVLILPTGIWVDKQNRRLYVADWIGDEILSFDLEGKPLHVFGSWGKRAGAVALLARYRPSWRHTCCSGCRFRFGAFCSLKARFPPSSACDLCHRNAATPCQYCA